MRTCGLRHGAGGGWGWRYLCLLRLTSMARWYCCSLSRFVAAVQPSFSTCEGMWCTRGVCWNPLPCVRAQCVCMSGQGLVCAVLCCVVLCRACTTCTALTRCAGLVGTQIQAALQGGPCMRVSMWVRVCVCARVCVHACVCACALNIRLPDTQAPIPCCFPCNVHTSPASLLRAATLACPAQWPPHYITSCTVPPTRLYHCVLPAPLANTVLHRVCSWPPSPLHSPPPPRPLLPPISP